MEALASVSAIRRFHPHLPCCIITDSHVCGLPDDVQIVLREPEDGNFPMRVKPRYLGDSPFECTLFLDTDTTVVRPIEDLFHVLKRFDIAAYVLPRYLRHDKYGFLPFLNSGVLLFRRCQAVNQVFKKWLELFDAQVDENRSRGSNVFIPDDVYLIFAICDSAARLMPLPPSMNFMLQIPTVTASPIHIVHGRHGNPTRLAEVLDHKRPTSFDARVWVPRLHGRLPDANLRSPAMWLHAPFYAAHVIVYRLMMRAIIRSRLLLAKGND